MEITDLDLDCLLKPGHFKLSRPWCNLINHEMLSWSNYHNESSPAILNSVLGIIKIDHFILLYFFFLLISQHEMFLLYCSIYIYTHFILSASCVVWKGPLIIMFIIIFFFALNFLPFKRYSINNYSLACM